MVTQTLSIDNVPILLGLESGTLRSVTLPILPPNFTAGLLRKIQAELSRFEFSFGAASDFTRRVWKRLTEIPHGETINYSQLAADLGAPGAARAVGNACASNPLLLVVPCHRVLAKNGLGGFRAGLEWKQKLLSLEREP